MALRRMVEIASDGRHLSVHRGFMVVAENGEEVARMPMDDIAAVIANAHGLTFSKNLLTTLADKGAAMVLCGANHSPKAILWPVEGHHMQTGRIQAQIAAPRPLCKRLWQCIAREKIRQQGAVAGLLGGNAGPFEMMARKVRSGDPDNMEAQAARRYWPILFGAKFRRDRFGSGPNGLLNYGYTVLRAATARAVMGAGLHPSIGLHHRNLQNAMCLVDDLMEPFRPLVDLAVVRLASDGGDEVTPEAKRALAELMYTDMQTEKGVTPLMVCLERLATSLAASFESQALELEFPLAALPLDLSGLGRA